MLVLFLMVKKHLSIQSKCYLFVFFFFSVTKWLLFLDILSWIWKNTVAIDLYIIYKIINIG